MLFIYTVPKNSAKQSSSLKGDIQEQETPNFINLIKYKGDENQVQSNEPYFVHPATPQILAQVHKDKLESGHCTDLPFWRSWEHYREGGKGKFFLFTL